MYTLILWFLISNAQYSGLEMGKLLRSLVKYNTKV
jgi:hypothetical protein